MNPDEKFEALPIIDKTEFADDEFIDEVNNKKSVIQSLVPVRVILVIMLSIR